MVSDKVERDGLPYTDWSQRFHLHNTTKVYTNQFSQLYNQRLNRMRDVIKIEAIKRWGQEINILDRIIDSEIENENESARGEVVIMGTIYKEMPLRSSVLDEFKDNNGISGASRETNVENYCSTQDSLVLEDESGRILLSGSIKKLIHLLVTGICVAIRGEETMLGTFHAVDFVFLNGSTYPGIDSMIHRAINRESAEQIYSSYLYEDSKAPLIVPKSSYILFISDLHVGGVSEHVDIGLSCQMLFDFVSGRLGDDLDAKVARCISRVVVVGNSVAPNVVITTQRDKYSSAKQHVEMGVPLKQLDILFSQMLGCCPIDVMPGREDPSNITLPQQPLHPCLFPHSSRFSNLHLVTNPYEFALGGHKILGHSGQPIDDILRQTSIRLARQTLALSSDGEGRTATANDIQVDNLEAQVGGEEDDSLDVLRRTLVWGHMCPTAPDTLPCHPFTDDDPFILAPNSVPRILFTGCRRRFATSLETFPDGMQSRLVCVPSFFLTQQAVLVDINTLQYQVLEF